MDEGPSDIVVADKPDIEPDARLLGKAEGCGGGGVRNADDRFGAGTWVLDGELFAELAADFVDIIAENEAVGTGKIDVFENAVGAMLDVFKKRDLKGGDARSIDFHHFARLYFADHLRADEIERAGFRREQPALAEFSEDERPHAARVSRAVQSVGCEKQH